MFLKELNKFFKDYGFFFIIGFISFITVINIAFYGCILFKMIEINNRVMKLKNNVYVMENFEHDNMAEYDLTSTEIKDN